MTTTTTDRRAATCQFEHVTWGPNEGCKEFMTEPEVWACGQPATQVHVVTAHVNPGDLVVSPSGQVFPPPSIGASVTTYCTRCGKMVAGWYADDPDVLSVRVNPLTATATGPLDRATPATDLTDQQLWIQFMAEDREMGYGDPDEDRHAALNAEIAARFGPDATERTATWACDVHASSDDLIAWATDSYPHLLAVATGSDPDGEAS